MTLPDTLVHRIEAIARREGRKPEEVLQSLLDAYEEQHINTDSVEDFIGIFDDDVNDLSVTVRETLHRKFRQTDDSSA